MSLRRTLAAISRVCVPAELACELIVVDNCSHDETPRVCRDYALESRLPFRHVIEPRVGKAFAMNRGIESAQGEIILFTDDDVIPPLDWITAMCRPILCGEAHAVAGGVRIPPSLERPWMEPIHRAWLAENLGVHRNDGRVELVGANTAFSRVVLCRIPGFDPNLGPGALGFGDDGLFARAIKKAGFRLVFAPVFVDHFFDESRLRWSSFADAARKRGRSAAYLAHHWEGRQVTVPALRLAKRRMMLAYSRYRRGRSVTHEGMPTWEMHALWSIAFFEQFLVERRKPRYYDSDGTPAISAMASPAMG